MDLITLRKKATLMGCFLRKNADGRHVLLDTVTSSVVHGPKLTLDGVIEWINQQCGGCEQYAFINTLAGNNLMAADRGGSRYQEARKRYDCFITENNKRLTKTIIEAEAARIVAEVQS